MSVGKSEKRVDAFDKVTGRAKYTEDLIDPSAYVAKIVHSTIPHGRVVSIDTSEAEKIEGLVKIVTCFDVPKHGFPTAGHPWSTDPSHQDIADRRLLNEHVRYYGDDVAVVIAKDEVSASQALNLVKVEYEEYPAVFDVFEAMKDGAPQLHEDFPNNIIKHTTNNRGNYQEAIKEEGLIKVEGWYDTPVVQHSHIENGIVYSYEESGKIVVVASTQIPHIVRRITGQALGIPWGKVRIIKPYIGGGFGNKQDALYEPLGAFLTTQVGGHPVKLDTSREETFVSNRTRHKITIHIVSYLRKDGTFAARKMESFANNGAYASHGHSIAAKGLGCFHQLYPCDNVEGDAYTVYTNRPVAGAMRGYGIPQSMFAVESHTEDIAKALGMDALEFRMKNLMPQGYVDGFSKNENYYDSFRECLEVGKKAIDYDKKMEEYKNQTGNIRRGIGHAVFWYNTAVYPISLETSACRMVLHQDGSVQLMLGETEIGQGADTAFSQMAADAIGVKFEDIHIATNQDTDVTPFGTAAYASRQTFIASFSITKTARILREKIFDHAYKLLGVTRENIDLIDGNLVRISDNRILMSLGELATTELYSFENSEHITAESTYQIRNNAYSFGCSFAEVEVDLGLCKATVKRLINVHDCGKLINPQLAEAQAHGGMSMAIGYALTEELKYDEKTGRTLNNNLLDYKLSTTMDHPDLEVHFVENPEPTSPYGTKSLGEPPTCSPAPAIRNAIYNATGVAVNQCPMNPHVLYPLFNEAGLLDNLEIEF
ncbi:xanthine dehydrogenase molybdenum-binding subunit [Peptoniphilus asaccharolyticus DSM 20463]|uniref:Xanthine dehydrogenase molybdenum-binding subunit n=1 Tax=Peptoniphilus asaccharolyticus DSM 20463 TaxID=573058 RepID=A0A1W1UH82_PEPAS|nr:xanthine dehydrogenase subunit XdhA [Peptoniphilus asaccharolyticus]MBL7574722.1 xanthine dehydrogenase molybdenum-binding subunit XdhA [Peptoniphilus asaccharolyticus]SMB80456.1 xanthine dehydrogenase molybdenum-binding subunit [Peptoniphilus asaccharolyticus DSM 20463]